jgi:hypothetical protein
MLDLEDLDFSNMDLIFHLRNNSFHSICHVQAEMWIGDRKVQTPCKDYMFRVSENMFRKIVNEFLGTRSWGRGEYDLLIVKPGEFMNMDAFCL